jgi:hypothetical protein
LAVDIEAGQSVIRDLKCTVHQTVDLGVGQEDVFLEASCLALNCLLLDLLFILDLIDDQTFFQVVVIQVLEDVITVITHHLLSEYAFCVGSQVYSSLRSNQYLTVIILREWCV